MDPAERSALSTQDSALIARRLAALPAPPRFEAVRFDDGPALRGPVVVLPSAYNPPTRAHFGLLELACGAAGAAECVALLSTNNVDKGLHGAPLEDRIAMLLAARSAPPAPAVFATNAARLLDQGTALSAMLPGVELDFAVGYDTLVRMFDPKYYGDMTSELDAFFAKHRLIAANRAHITVDDVRGFLDEPHVRPWAGRVVVAQLDDEHAWLSSSLVRDAVADGEEHPAVLPAVARYIAETGLYREPGAPAPAS